MLTTTSLVPKFTMSSRIMPDEVVGWFGGCSPTEARRRPDCRISAPRCSKPLAGLLHVPTAAPRGDVTQG